MIYNNDTFCSNVPQCTTVARASIKSASMIMLKMPLALARASAKIIATLHYRGSPIANALLNCTRKALLLRVVRPEADIKTCFSSKSNYKTVTQ